MALLRSANATWSGDLLSGKGTVSLATGLLTDSPTTWSARTEAPEGKTSPEELLAAAHASCFSMALANTLAKDGFRAERLEVTAEVNGDKREAGWTVLSSHLTVRGRVPNIDEAAFVDAANRAKDGCPISRALVNNVELSVDATLEA